MRLTESGTCDNFIEYFSFFIFQSCCHCIKITISPAPEIQLVYFGCCLYHLRLFGIQGNSRTGECFHSLAVHILQSDLIGQFTCFPAVVPYFRLGMNFSFTPFDVEIRSIDVYTGSFQITVKRKSLIHFVCNMQKDIFGNTTIVCIEITIVPLKFRFGIFFPVLPVVINTYGEHVVSFFHKRSQVETYCHDTILVNTQIFSV